MSEPPAGASLRGKRCLVTGGSRGLGLALCEAFARAGAAAVAFTYSEDDADAAEARERIRRAGLEPRFFKGSVADGAHVASVVSDLVQRWGGIDVLVNNAGITQVLPLALVDEADWDTLMAVNAKGAFLFSKAVLRGMVRAKAGHVLNVGNFASERLIEAPVHYAASKSALRGLTEALAREVGRHGVRVNLLAPGLLDTGLGRMLPEHRVAEYVEQCPAGRVGRIEEIAELAVFLVSDANSFMTGAKVTVDGGT